MFTISMSYGFYFERIILEGKDTTIMLTPPQLFLGVLAAH